VRLAQAAKERTEPLPAPATALMFVAAAEGELVAAEPAAVAVMVAKSGPVVAVAVEEVAPGARCRP
jgi:hypothetical protein